MKKLSIIILLSMFAIISCDDATTNPEQDFEIGILTYLDSEKTNKSSFSIQDSIIVEIQSNKKLVYADVKIEYKYANNDIGKMAISFTTNSSEDDNRYSAISAFKAIIAGDVQITAMVENKGQTSLVNKNISITE